MTKLWPLSFSSTLSVFLVFETNLLYIFKNCFQEKYNQDLLFLVKSRLLKEKWKQTAFVKLFINAFFAPNRESGVGGGMGSRPATRPCGTNTVVFVKYLLFGSAMKNKKVSRLSGQRGRAPLGVMTHGHLPRWRETGGLCGAKDLKNITFDLENVLNTLTIFSWLKMISWYGRCSCWYQDSTRSSLVYTRSLEDDHV